MNIPQHDVDHFVVGINELDKGIETFEALTGVRARPGGFHPLIGTCNALLAIGESTYLEIIAPDPGADSTKLNKELKALFTDPLARMDALTPYLWAVSSTDLVKTVKLLDSRGIQLSKPEQGARKRPDGKTVEWSASFVTSPAFPGAPFFIQWLDPATAPPSDSPKGCLLEDFSLAGPHADRLESVVRTLGLEIPVRPAPELHINLTLNTPRGTVQLFSR